jgi:hypothetical protein
MKILFVWDNAGVSSILAKWLRKGLHEVDVMVRKETDDFGFAPYYGDIILDLPNYEFSEYIIGIADKYDLIHVNSLPKLAGIIKSLYPSKKVVLHYHGSDARLSNKKERERYERVVDRVLVSTPDLHDLVDNAIYSPTPVDTELFKPTIHKDGVLFIQPPNTTVPNTPFEDMVIIDREKDPITYENMPDLFMGFNIYVDIKHRNDSGDLPPLSKTALEALATGMKVYGYDRKLISGLPKIHEPSNVIHKLLQVYNSI